MIETPDRGENQGNDHADDQEEILTEKNEDFDQTTLFRCLLGLSKRDLQMMTEIVQLRYLEDFLLIEKFSVQHESYQGD